MRIIGPSLRGKHSPAKTEHHDRSGQHSIPEIDSRYARGRRSTQSGAHGQKFGEQYPEYSEDQKMVTDGEDEVEHDEVRLRREPQNGHFAG